MWNYSNPISRNVRVIGAKVICATTMVLLCSASPAKSPAGGTKSSGAAGVRCKLDNPIAVSGEVKAFGTHGRTCELANGELTIHVTDRDGDWAICCVDLAVPIKLEKRTNVCATVSSEQAEKTVDVKLEDSGSQSKQVFLAHEQSVGKGEKKTFSHTLTNIEQKWQTNRICLASVGGGPVPNKMTLHEIGFIN